MESVDLKEVAVQSGGENAICSGSQELCVLAKASCITGYSSVN